jgi:hypothetical protein
MEAQLEVYLPDHLYKKGGEEFPELMKETEKDCLAARAPGVAPAVSPLLKGETLRVLVPQLCKIATPFAHFHEKNQNIKSNYKIKYKRQLSKMPFICESR